MGLLTGQCARSFENLLPSLLQDLFGDHSVMHTLRLLLGLGLALVGLCDVIVFFLIFLARPKYFVMGKYRHAGGRGSRCMSGHSAWGWLLFWFSLHDTRLARPAHAGSATTWVGTSGSTATCLRCTSAWWGWY